MMVMMMMVMMMTRMPAIVSGGASGSNDHRGEDELPDSWESPCLNIEAPVRKCFKSTWNHKIMMLRMKFFGWIMKTTMNVFNRSEITKWWLWWWWGGVNWISSATIESVSNLWEMSRLSIIIPWFSRWWLIARKLFRTTWMNGSPWRSIVTWWKCPQPFQWWTSHPSSTSKVFSLSAASHFRSY